MHYKIESATLMVFVIVKYYPSSKQWKNIYFYTIWIIPSGIFMLTSDRTGNFQIM